MISYDYEGTPGQVIFLFFKLFIMTIQVIKIEDFEVLKSELLSDISRLITESQSKRVGQEWLTEKEACEFLDVSKSTIQGYRLRGKLPYSQIGNKIKYKLDDIQSFLTINYIDHGKV